MHQMNRKPKSLEQAKLEQNASAPPPGSEQEILQLIQNMNVEGGGSKIKAYVPPTELELLRLAGGDKPMVFTGKEGMELRSVLAHRVRMLHQNRFTFLCFFTTIC
jgi:hypothetical protein